MPTTTVHSKHTPGPWKAIPCPSPMDKSAFGVAAVEPMRGRIDSSLQGMTEANARLIAAAPDLLEACKQLVNAAYKPCGHQYDCICAGDLARAAIAKAEGAK